MKNKTKAYTIGVICVIVLALLLSSSFLVNFRLDQLWFKSVGYDSVFWQTLLWKGLVGLGIFGIAFLLSFANLRAAFARCGQKRGSLGRHSIAIRSLPDSIQPFLQMAG